MQTTNRHQADGARARWTSDGWLRTAALLCFVLSTYGGFALSEEGCGCREAAPQIEDVAIRDWYDLTYSRKPPAPVPGIDYGMSRDGKEFLHPKATPLVEDEQPRPFSGQLEVWEQDSYAHNVNVIAFYQHVTNPGQTWQAIVDFDGRRYMYVTYRRQLAVWDITDPANAEHLEEYGDYWGAKGPIPNERQLPPGETLGGIVIRWSDTLKKHVLVQSAEVQRFGIFEDKVHEPEGVQQLRYWKYNKGFGVYAINGPLFEDWELIATRTTDYEHPDALPGQQQGSGSLDAPMWFGGKYMFLSAAPDDTYALTEYPNYLHSPGFQSWDMSDPSNPVFLDQLTALGQILGRRDHEDAYLMNPRAGNRTSWMGSRMPLFVPVPVEDGGKIGFAAMGGLGFYTVDISDPASLKVLGHLEFPPKVAGTEADNVDIGQYERTGYVFMNGYPMNNDCYEPYKDIFVIDVRDPMHPQFAATFPRPMPAEAAPYSDYCQRRGSFGPKRSGYISQPGRSRDGLVAYAFYNAGVQLFDVADPTHPKIVGYYVPRFPKADEIPEFMYGNLAYGIFVEYDRNIIWMFTNHGMYALSSPLLGDPVVGVPSKPWPPRQ